MPTTWYYSKGGQQFGPVQLTQLQDLCRSGQLSLSDLVWEEGSPQWVALGTRADLLALAQPRRATAPPPPPRTGPVGSGSEGQRAANVKAMAAAGATFAGSAMHRASKSLRQTFGDAATQTMTQVRAAIRQVIKHPFRLSFVTAVFVMASGIALASLVAAVLFPVFVMGYITYIRAIIAGKPTGLEGFIGFMRHGWDSCWHLLMLLAAFYVTIAAMLTPFILAGLLLYFVFGTLGALITEAGSHSSDTTTYERPRTSYQPRSPSFDDFDRPAPNSKPRKPSKLGEAIMKVIAAILDLGLRVILMFISVIVLTPLSSAMILFFFLVLEVSKGNPNAANRFELVYSAFGKMLATGTSHWKEVLMSGLSVSICLIGVCGAADLLAYLFSTVKLYVLAEWAFAGLLPAAMCVFVVYLNVFVTITCLSLGDRVAGSAAP